MKFYSYIILFIFFSLSATAVHGQSDRLPGNATSTQQQGYLVNSTDTATRQNWLYYGNGKADRMVRYPELLRTTIVNQSYAQHYVDSLNALNAKQNNTNYFSRSQHYNDALYLDSQSDGLQSILFQYDSGYDQLYYNRQNRVFNFNRGVSAGAFISGENLSYFGQIYIGDAPVRPNDVVRLVDLAGYGTKTQQDANTSAIAGKADTSRSTYQLSQVIGTNGTQDLSLNAVVTTADYTTQIQSVLNKAAAGKPIRVIWDIKASVRSLKVYSNTEISALPGAGALLRDSTNAQMFQNAAFNYTGAIKDSNIVIRGGVWNMNGIKQVHDNTTVGWVSGMRFGAVKNLVLDQMTIYRARTFARWVVNSTNFSLTNSIIKAGSGQINTDGEHISAGTSKFQITGNTYSVADDAIPLNADDALPGNTFQATGPITDYTIRDNYFDNSQFGVRLLSGASRIDRGIIDNLNGITQNYAVVADNYYQNYTSTSPTKFATTTDGTGNFGTLSISNINVDVQKKSVTFPIQPGIISMAGQFDNVLISNIGRRAFAYNAPMINIGQTYTNIKRLAVSNLTSIDSAGTNTNPAILFSGGAIGELVIDKAHVEKPADADAPIFSGTGGSIGTFKTIGGYSNHIATPYKFTGTTVGNFQSTNNTHLNTSATTPFISSSTAIPYADVRGYRGNNIANGSTTITPRTDTAFVKRGSYDYTMDGLIGANTASATLAGSPINYSQEFGIGTNTGVIKVLNGSGTPTGFQSAYQLNGDNVHGGLLYSYGSSGTTTMTNSFGLKFYTASGGTAWPAYIGNGATGITATPNQIAIFPNAGVAVRSDGTNPVNNSFTFDVQGTLNATGASTVRDFTTSNGGARSAAFLAGGGTDMSFVNFNNGNTNSGNFNNFLMQGSFGNSAGYGKGAVIYNQLNQSGSAFWYGLQVAVNPVTVGTGTNRLFTVGTATGISAGNPAGYAEKAGVALDGTLGMVHLKGLSAAPTITAGTGAGASPTITISGTDVSGTITLTTGSSPAAGAVIATLTFNSAYGSAPHPAGNPAAKNAVTASLTGNASPYFTTTTTTLVLNGNSTALAPNTTYVWDYTLTQ
ncbi:beta strand repeat-containing protein [Mucilaginibacter sp.]